MEQEKIKLKLFPPQPPPSMEEERKYAELFNWLNDTKVLVHEDYVGDSKQPIRSLFGKLGLFYPFIQKFIIFKKNEGQDASRQTIEEMAKIIREMDIEYKKIPRTNGSSEFQQFLKAWQAKFGSYLDKYKDNEVLMSFLDNFGNLYHKDIWFDIKKLENILTLFYAINSWDDGDSILDELVKTYCEDPLKYFEWFHAAPTRYGGGRKLTRRRKSNPKSKSKRKHKRRSYKKSSYKRQRH